MGNNKITALHSFLAKQNEIEQLKDTNSAIEQYVGLLRPLIMSSNSVGSLYQPGTSVFRATSHHTHFPESLKEISYPPEDRTGLNRANKPQKPMFYCSFDPDTTVLELKLVPQFYCVLAQWRVDCKMYLHQIGYLDSVFNRLGGSRTVNGEKSHLDNIYGSEVRNFIHHAFTEAISPNYKLTAAIAEILLNGDFLSGIKYPSIMKMGNSDNVALQPDFVEKHLKLVEAHLYEVSKIKGVNIFSKQIAVANDVSTNKQLKWRSPDPNARSIKVEETITIKNDSFYILTRGRLVSGSIHIDLEPGYLIDVVNGLRMTVRNLQKKIIADFIPSSHLTILPPRS